MAGKLQIALENWIYNKFQPEGGPGWWGRVKARFNESSTLIAGFIRNRGLLTLGAAPLVITAAIGYTLTGWAWGHDYLIKNSHPIVLDEFSQDLAAVMQSVFSQPAAKEIAETLGALVTEPILAMFEQYAGQENPDPKEFARAFHGFMIGLNLSGSLADTALETATGGQVEGVGRLLMSMYWSLGLGFLGWQTLAPLLENGLQPGLRRYYTKLYRPERFAAADLRDLYAIGKISLAQFKEQLADAGWRDADHDTWIELAYRTLAEGDVWTAFHEHHIDEAEATRRLRILGFNPADIPLLFKLNPSKDVSEVRDFSASTARRAFRDGLISSAELTAILKNLDYSDQEIAVIIQIEELSRRQDVKALSQAQIKSAWEENVLTDPEAVHWLEISGFGPDERAIILETWKAEAVPEFRKLNLGTITGAYIEGVLNRSQAQTKLEGVGLHPDDAKLELDLVEKRNPEAFGGAIPVAKRFLSAGQLADLVVVGLITSTQMQTALRDQGYTENDARLLTEAAVKELVPTPRPLSQLSIERGYIARVVQRSEALELLLELGINAENAEIVLKTVEAENAAVFGGSSTEAVKLLTPGILEDLRIAGLITSDQMNSYLLTLNLSADDAALLVRRAEQLAAPFVRLLNAVQIERAYLAGVVNRALTLEKLAEVGYTPTDAEELVSTWEAENPVVFDPTLAGSLRTPSITTLAAAVRNGILTELEYFARALDLGYTQNDATIYLSLATRQERKAVKTLTDAQIVSAYDAGLLAWTDALDRLTRTGLSPEDATLVLRTRKDLIENTDIWYSLSSGDLDALSAIGQLTSAGYSDADILTNFARLDPGILAASGLTFDDLRAILTEIPGGV